LLGGLPSTQSGPGGIHWFGPGGAGVYYPQPSPTGSGLPIPIPPTTDTASPFPEIRSPGLETAAQPNGPFGLQPNPIESVIARLGIHPQSGLAQAFRAIHSALTTHLAQQAAHNRAQVGHGLTEPSLIFHNPTVHHPAPVHQRPGPVLQ